MGTKRIIDYLLITKTVPEWSKRDETLYTCSLGISPQLGLIRLYPLPPTGMDKYGVYRLEVEKNKRDSRNESWKITSYARHEGWTNLGDDVKLIGYKDEFYVGEYLSKFISCSVSNLNKQRRSIGVLKVDRFKAFWDVNKNFFNDKQIGLFADVGEDVEVSKHINYTKETKEKECRIKFFDQDGEHNIQYNEWHYYEGQRNYGALPRLLDPLNNKERDILLVGNMLQYQNNWIGLGKFKGYTNQLSLI